MSDGDTRQPGPPRERYQFLDVFGRGGTGVVYRAIDTALDWEVAVKVLHDRFGPESAAAHQFIAAARIAGRLQHPGIPQVHDIGALPDGRPFFVMKLIRGRTLQDVLDEGSDPVAERGDFWRSSSRSARRSRMPTTSGWPTEISSRRTL